MADQLITGDRVLLIIVLLLWLPTLWRHGRRRFRKIWHRAKERLPRRWKPKTPLDCPHCCRQIQLKSYPINQRVTPYSERKSGRGRKKEIEDGGLRLSPPRLRVLRHHGGRPPCSGRQRQTRPEWRHPTFPLPVVSAGLLLSAQHASLLFYRIAVVGFSFSWTGGKRIGSDDSGESAGGRIAQKTPADKPQNPPTCAQ